jgi:ribosomal protein L11 methyltransferase
VTWTSVRVRAPGPDRPAIIAALFELGSQGVHEDGETLVTHFPAPFSIEAIAAGVRDVSASAEIETSSAPDVDWSERWRDRIGSHELGRLTVAPPWLASADNDARTIVIDPGMAFGTGDHASTRGVIRLLGDVIAPGSTVADLGAGSGVLAIAAAKLGARAVFAIEVDPDAISNAEANVVRNGVADRVTVIEGDARALLPIVGPVDVIVVNIISSVIMTLLREIADGLNPNGTVILAGILAAERDDMVGRLEHAGWQVGAEDVEGEWWSAIARRA